MKKSFFVAVFFLFLYSWAFSDGNPFLGKWDMEIIGVEEHMSFEFVDNTKYIITSPDGDTAEAAYTLDLVNQTIEIDLDNDMNEAWAYYFTGNDEFYLYIQNEESMFIQAMTQSFNSAREQYINSLTDEFWNLLVYKVTEAVLESPMAWGVRVDQ